jgi:hypothetical protein
MFEKVKEYFQSELEKNNIAHVDLDAVLSAKPRGFAVGSDTVAGVTIKTYGSVPHIEAGLWRLVQTHTQQFKEQISSYVTKLREGFVLPTAKTCAGYDEMEPTIRKLLIDQISITFITGNSEPLTESISGQEDQIALVNEINLKLNSQIMELGVLAESSNRDFVIQQMETNKLKEAFLCFWLSLRSGEEFGLADLYGMSEEDVDKLYELQERELGKSQNQKPKEEAPPKTPEPQA